VKKLELENIKADLRGYLRNNNALISPEFRKVVADVARFVDVVIRDGFKVALTQSLANVNVQPDSSFIEVAEALVEHHIRFLRQVDREIAHKSLLEAYTHIADPRFVFEPTRKTEFVNALRRSGPKKFAALIISLHLYNVICGQIQNDLHRRIPDPKTLQLYLLKVEALCRDIIADIVKVQPAECDEEWALAVIRSVETQLLRPQVPPTKSSDLSIPTGYKK